ncbi:MAG: GNAT family N-acetyltransferase [Bacteroidota bacterium]
MAKYTIRQYEKKDYSAWNTFISEAKNATFLFHRDFMEYHQDRFEDYSLMVFDADKLVAVLPANRVGDIVHSHQGLTYGGLVLKSRSKLNNVILIFKSVLEFLNLNNIEKLNIKMIPSFYCKSFSEELDYCLFILKANLYRRESLSVLNLKDSNFVSKTRRESINRGIKNGLKIVEEYNFELFWNQILIPNLQKKHNAKPVHTVEEITQLKNKFPNHIRHFNVYYQNEIVAGTTIFITDSVAHPQYVSGNEKKNELGSLDFLYNYLITDIFKDKSYFDFGPSHEDNGKKINKGILFWKESFGAKTIIQSFYEVTTSRYLILDDILI